MEERIKKIESAIKHIQLNQRIYLPLLMICIAVFSVLASSSWKSYDIGMTRHYNNGVLVTREVKQFHVSFTPTVANGGTFDISSYGLTAILDVQAMITKNTGTVGDVPAIALKSVTTSTITYNLTQANNATVAILGINVLSGSPQTYVTNFTGTTINLQITGY